MMWSDPTHCDPSDEDLARTEADLDRERRCAVLSDLEQRFKRPGVAAVLRRLRLRDAHRLFVAIWKVAA